MDLTTLSDNDLLAVHEGRLSDVSDEGLLTLRDTQAQSPITANSPQLEQPGQKVSNSTPLEEPREKTGFFASAWEGVKQGVTLGFGDEIQSAVAASVAAPFSDLSWSEAYDMALGDFREEQSQAKEDNALAYYPGEIAGAVLTGGAGASRLGGAKLATFTAKAPMRTAAATGGSTGALYGFGTGEGGLEERTKSAGIGGVTGTVAGPAGAYIGGKVANAGKSLSNFFKSGSKQTDEAAGSLATVGTRALDEIVDEADTIATAPKGTVNTQVKATDKIVKALKKDFPDNWEEVLEVWQKSGEPLAKIYSSRVGSLGKGAAQYPAGKARADQYFDEQISASSERLKTAIRTNITDKDLYHATVDDVIEAGRAKAKPLYDQAYKGNKSIVSREIDNVLATPAGRKALKDTAKIMQNDRSLLGLPDTELKAIARDLEAVGKMDEIKGPIASGLNLRTLDAVKKNLDDQINKLYRAGDKYEGGVLNNLKNTLVKALDDADTTGAYKKAREEAGDYLGITRAMDDGRKFMKQDPELLRKTVKDMTKSERDAFKIGVGKEVRDIIDKAREGANPYGKIFGSREAKERLYSVLDPDEFLNLEKALKAENKLFKLRNETLGGSPTTSKAIAAAEIASGAGDVAQALATGNPRTVGLGTLASMAKKMVDGLNDDMADAVGRLLYETDPTKKLMLIDRAVGSKKFTEAEKQIIKQAYFTVDEAFAARAAGASGASIGTSSAVLDAGRFRGE